MADYNVTKAQSEAEWISAMRLKTEAMRLKTEAMREQTTRLQKQVAEIRAQNEELARQNSELFGYLPSHSLYHLADPSLNPNMKSYDY